MAENTHNKSTKAPSPCLRAEKLSHNANREPSWSPDLIFIIHLPSQSDSKSTFNDLRPHFPEEFYGCFGWL